MVGSLIEGQVSDAHGRPIAAVRIAFSAAPVVMPEVALLSDARGAFRLGVPVTGSYELTFTHEGMRPEAIRFEAKAGDTVRMNVVMSAS